MNPPSNPSAGPAPDPQQRTREWLLKRNADLEAELAACVRRTVLHDAEDEVSTLRAQLEKDGKLWDELGCTYHTGGMRDPAFLVGTSQAVFQRCQELEAENAALQGQLAEIRSQLMMEFKRAEAAGVTLTALRAQLEEAVKENIDWKASRQRVRDSFQHRSEPDTCECVYCRGDADGLAEHAADYEMQHHSAIERIAELETENAALRARLAAHETKETDAISEDSGSDPHSPSCDGNSRLDRAPKSSKDAKVTRLALPPPHKEEENDDSSSRLGHGDYSKDLKSSAKTSTGDE